MTNFSLKCHRIEGFTLSEYSYYFCIHLSLLFRAAYKFSKLSIKYQLADGVEYAAGL